MLPRRLQIIYPYLTNRLHAQKDLPSLQEVIYFLTQPSKRKRGQRYIEHSSEEGEYLAIKFVGYDKLFYYPKNYSWVDFCATVDEVFNPQNWHHYETQETPLYHNDIVVDCGCAEGLFTFVAASKVEQVFAFEPLPGFLKPLLKMFEKAENVQIYPAAVSNQETYLQFTNNGIYSALSSQGEVTVEVTTLDKALAHVTKRISYIKADIEGHEFQMLLGAHEIIKQHRPKLALTVYHKENDVVSMEKYLSSIHSDYRFCTKGIVGTGNPVMLHVW